MTAAAGFCVSLALGSMFAVSGFGKRRSGTFAAAIANYRLLPRRSVVPVARVLPWIEMTVGAAIVLVPSPAPFMLIAALLLTAFTAGVVINLGRRRRISCGCRGSARPITWRLAGANLTWIAAAVAAAWSSAPSAGVALRGADPTLLGGDAWGVAVCVALSWLSVRMFTSWQEVRSALRPVAAVLVNGQSA